MKQLHIYYHSIALVNLLAALTGCTYNRRNNMMSQQKVVMEYQEGIDISHHQGEIDWSQLTPSNSHKAFVIIKATECATYQDPRFVENFNKAFAAGFRTGAYHFLRFGSSSASDQMKNFLFQIQKTEQLTDQNKLTNHKPIIALDIEESKGADYSLVGSLVEESIRYLKEQAGIKPFIYTRQNFWDAHVKSTPDIVKACPLWIARYRKTPPSSNELPNGWQEWAIWQYSSTGSVPGIKGNVDLNKIQYNQQIIIE